MGLTKLKSLIFLLLLNKKVDSSGLEMKGKTVLILHGNQHDIFMEEVIKTNQEYNIVESDSLQSRLSVTSRQNCPASPYNARRWRSIDPRSVRGVRLP